MKDRNIKSYMKIVNSARSPIWTLARQNEKYGTGFDLWRTGEKQITLELMDDSAKYGKVVDSIVLNFNVDICDADELSEDGWVNHVCSLFERELFNKQAA